MVEQQVSTIIISYARLVARMGLDQDLGPHESQLQEVTHFQSMLLLLLLLHVSTEGVNPNIHK